MIFRPSYQSKEIKSNLNREFSNLAILYHDDVILIDVLDIPDIVKVLVNNYFKMATRSMVKNIVNDFNNEIKTYKNENI